MLKIEKLKGFEVHITIHNTWAEYKGYMTNENLYVDFGGACHEKFEGADIWFHGSTGREGCLNFSIGESESCSHFCELEHLKDLLDAVYFTASKSLELIPNKWWLK